MQSVRYTTTILILVVGISGMSQGLTIPLLTLLLKDLGFSSLANGINATALYVGILLVSPWLEKPLRRFGYRTMILAGLVLMMLSTVLSPVFQTFSLWYVLRFLLGVGNVGLHYASEIWISIISPLERRGRNLSLYGLSYGIGFSLGPLGIYLIKYGIFAPFLAISVIYGIAFILLLLIQNTYPEKQTPHSDGRNRYLTVIKLGWLALLPSFLYGYMEASLNSSFPIYALKMGLSPKVIPLLLLSFTLGSLMLQFPLGLLSDRYDRKHVIMLCATTGSILFLLVPQAESVWQITVLFALAGGLIGSFFSLGLAYVSDILPRSLITTAVIILEINFSIASILAPGINGYILDYLPRQFMFYILGFLLLSFSFCGLFFAQKTNVDQVG